MRANHRGADIAVAEEFLNRTGCHTRPRVDGLQKNGEMCAGLQAWIVRLCERLALPPSATQIRAGDVCVFLPLPYLCNGSLREDRGALRVSWLPHGTERLCRRHN